MRLEARDIEAMDPDAIKVLADRLGIAGRQERTMPYTLAEAAKALHCHESTVSRCIDTGAIKRVPGITRKLVPAAEVQRMLDGDKQ